MRGRRRWWALAIGAAAGAACTSGNLPDDSPFAANDAGADATLDATKEAAPPRDAIADATAADRALADAGADATADGGVDGNDQDAADAFVEDGAARDAACAGRAGPPLVHLGPFCVDATEVTNAQYAEMLSAAADGGALPSPPAFCAWNLSLVPGAWPPVSGHDADPVAAVDWCDAWTYCAWAGKRLCGRIGGGAMPFAAWDDFGQSQWMNACAGADGGRAYPYGGAYDASACNGADYPPPKAPRAAGSLMTCVTSEGVYDMSGNVYEWEDSCDGTTGASDLCRTRGGGFATPENGLACAAGASLTRSPTGAFADVGFRCCAD